MARVEENMKEKLLEITEYVIGSLPIKYLGLPLSPKNRNKLDYYQITKKLRSILIRHLSYAGKVSALSVVHNYWTPVFILPQSAVKVEDRKYRDFFWGSTQEQKKNITGSMKTTC